jgi:hypothetical protein
MSRRFTLLVLFLVSFTLTARCAVIDETLHAKTHDDVLRLISSLRSKLTDQEALDLATAVRCIEREAFDQFAADLPKDRRESFFVSLIEGRSPRQIILMAACIARARSFQGLAGKSPDQLDHAEREFRGQLVSFASYALEAYLAPEKPNQSSEPTAPSGRGSR